MFNLEFHSSSIAQIITLTGAVRIWTAPVKVMVLVGTKFTAKLPVQCCLPH